MTRAVVSAAVALALGAGTMDVGAQEVPACPPVLHRMDSATMDSVLATLQPDEVALTGTVTDEATGEPVAGLHVRIEATDLATTTNDDGRYLIRDRTRVPTRAMVSVCSGWEYLREVRELFAITPWNGTVVVIDGTTMSDPGHAVRLDFRVRRRPDVF